MTDDYPAAVKAAATRRGITPAQYIANRDAGLKWCRECQEWRPLTDYKPSNSTPDGVRPHCTRHYTPRKPVPITHGLTGYRRGCRCDTCRAAIAAAQRRGRARRKADPAAADRAGHGKYSTYTNYECRCQPCTTAHTERIKPYQKAWQQRNREALNEKKRARYAQKKAQQS